MGSIHQTFTEDEECLAQLRLALGQALCSKNLFAHPVGSPKFARWGWLQQVLPQSPYNVLLKRDLLNLAGFHLVCQKNPNLKNTSAWQDKRLTLKAHSFGIPFEGVNGMYPYVSPGIIPTCWDAIFRGGPFRVVSQENQKDIRILEVPLF